MGAALYLNHDNKLIDEREIDALDFFTRLTTYYEHQQMLQQQKEDLHEGESCDLALAMHSLSSVVVLLQKCSARSKSLWAAWTSSERATSS